MSINIDILEGSKAIQALNSSENINNWKNFYFECECKTFFQSPNFVINWYSTYASEYEPLIIIGKSNSELIGLIFLANSKKNNSIVHAGAHQAEYHGWIARKNFESAFFIAFLKNVRNYIKHKTWTWRWLPPEFKSEWFDPEELRTHRIFTKQVHDRSPYVNLDSLDRLNKIKKNSAVKTKLKRYNKIGELTLEHITSKERAKKLFPELMLQYDFRQALKNGIFPFDQDKCKKEFYLNKMTFPENVHFTALLLNNEPIAFHIGDSDDKTVFYSVPTFNTLETKNSPGTLLLLKLLEKLVEENYKYLDLTPGLDPNKEKFANAYKDIYQLTIYFSFTKYIYSKIIFLIKNFTKYFVKKIHVDIDLVKKKVDWFKMKLKNISKIEFHEIPSKIFSWLYQSNHIYLYRYNLENYDKIRNFETNNVRVQQYFDLLFYTESIPWLSKTDLVRLAQSRFENNSFLFTIIQDSKLAHFSWAVKNKISHHFKEVGVTYTAPKSNVFLYDAYTDPIFRNKGYHLESLNYRIKKFVEEGIDNIYITVSENNAKSKRNLERTGFTIEKEFMQKVYLKHFSLKNF